MHRYLRQAASQARVVLTAPRRVARMKELCRQRKAPLSVAFYHRVADTHRNDWTISRDKFRQHLEYCRKHLEFVSLTEVQRRVAGSDSPRPTMTITFDDGYRENGEFAIPLLVEYEIPCVYFVAVDHVVKQIPFEHDLKRGKPLAVNTVGDLRDMAEQGIEIGLHTKNHVDFSRVHCSKTIRREIIEAKDELEQLIGQRVRNFAFPFGLPDQLTQAAIEAVYEAGLSGFCSAYGGYNLPGRDAFHIRRFHGDPEFARFRNWTTFDERKLRDEPRVRYFLPPAISCDETLQILQRELAVCP
jgi:peptidoglycan/xylan/chitin deacetylase (PgdA/CDA1 family)